MNERRGFRITIRAKLLLASLSLLVVPWLGYHYIQALEAYLRQAEEQKLLDRVSLVASLMHGQSELFRVQSGPATAIDSHLYVRPLHSPIQLDGYLDDWRLYDDRNQPLGKAENDKDLSVDYRFGSLNNYLYLMFQVKDDHVVYRQPNTLSVDRSDHLRIGILDRNGEFKRYRISTFSPGWVSAYLMPDDNRKTLPLQPEFRVNGKWQDVAGGYNIELRIPVDMIGGRLAFAMADVDDSTTHDVEAVVGDGNTGRPDGLGSIVIPSEQMETLLQRLQKPLSRIWVIDPKYRVIGMAGSLQQEDDPADDYLRDDNNKEQQTNLVQAFYRLVLEQPGNEFNDRFSSVSRLNDPAVTAALTGKPMVSWHQTDNEKVSVITAAHPVYVGDELVGALAIEETSNSILILQNRAIEALVNLSVLAFVLVISALLLFATRLSMRVKRLRDEVDESISHDGRVQGEIKLSKAGDELGDLGRSFHNMHKRLAQYNRYLETMAGKLAHELRTPITIVRSSLDNLEPEKLDSETQTYLNRAYDGVERLSGILSRMSEATHLEQTIQQEEAHAYRAFEVVTACVDGYRLAHSGRLFEFVGDGEIRIAEIVGSAELLAQLLDKLVSNALDFALPDTAISVALERHGNSLVLSVANQGPQLPQEMHDNLFDSMVSMRQGKSDQPHLGLGLYIVRLIADYHHAQVEVENLDAPPGVIFRVNFPLP